MPPRPTRKASTAASKAIAASAAETTVIDPTRSSSPPTDTPVRAKRATRSRALKPTTPIVKEDDKDVESSTLSSESSSLAPPTPPPAAGLKAKRGKKRKSGDLEEEAEFVAEKDEKDVLMEAVEEEKEAPKPKRARKKAAPQYELGEDGELRLGEDGQPILKAKVPRGKAKEVVIHDVPEVEKMQTTFKGRLGYACLNSLLRNSKPPVFCSRTLRLKGFLNENGMQRLVELTTQNTKDLITILEWNAMNKIHLFRLSSEMFPFASHKDHGYRIQDTLPEAMKNMAEAGRIVKEHNMRITVHPGQWTQLASPTEGVVENAVRELEYQCDMLEALGVGKDGVMVIHMGGMYGDKEATLERFKLNYPKLPERIKQRLVLENDEICYSASDLLPVCDQFQIPLVFDYHHDWINPSDLPPPLLMPFILKTWEAKGIRVKQHLSEARPGAVTVMERRGHSDRCDRLPLELEESRQITLRAIEEKRKKEENGEVVDDAQASVLGLVEGNERHDVLKKDILSEFGLRMGLPDDVDLMIEAKDKEQAVLHLYNLYDLGPVHRGSYLPPKPTPTYADSSDVGEDEGAALVDQDGKPIAKPVKPTLTPMAKAKKAKAKAKEEAKARREKKAEEKAAAEEAGGPKKAAPRKKALKKEVKEAGSGSELSELE